jgi:hypothetical protein
MDFIEHKSIKDRWWESERQKKLMVAQIKPIQGFFSPHGH